MPEEDEEEEARPDASLVGQFQARRHVEPRVTGTSSSRPCTLDTSSSTRSPQALGSLLAFLGAKTDPADLLPVKSGWLEKARPGWFNVWQERFFILSRKQLRWYKDAQDKVPLGVLDFDLVPCEVERLWSSQPASVSKEEAVARDLPQHVLGGLPRSRCGSCEPLVNLWEDRSAVFRICPVGSDRAFQLRAVGPRHGNAWVEALQRHIELAEADCKVPAELETFGRLWWKVDRISPEKFADLANTGDVLLFRSAGALPKLIRGASGGRFDHVALLLRLADGELGLLEATGTEGVALCTWSEFVENEWQNLYPEMALRRVRFERSRERLTALQTWATGVIGKPYCLTVGRLMQRNSVSAGGEPTDEAFFCSQLVAEGLKVLEVIPRGLSSTQFWPSTFAASQRPPIETTEDCLFGQELTIDFGLSRQAKARADDAGPKQVRDVTTAWK